MKCPLDQTALTMSERSGIEIDYCPICRGVWLDRGELDKLIDRNMAEPAQNGHFQQGQSSHATSEPSYDRDSHDYPKQNYRHRKKRKESFLGDLFDF